MRFRVVMCKMGYTELRFNIYIYIYIQMFLLVRIMFHLNCSFFKTYIYQKILIR